MSTEQQSILDQIAAEVAALTPEELAKAAAEIQARNDRARARVTPESKEKMKQREKKRRLMNSQILKLAKEQGLVPAKGAAAEGEANQG